MAVDETFPSGGDSREFEKRDPLGGLTNLRCLSLDRVPIRTREGSGTFSAWRLAAACHEGEGAISLIEISPTVSLYRGDGVFLGWTADRLGAAYHALKPQSDEPGFEVNQLG